jgi:hypothetical protein
MNPKPAKSALPPHTAEENLAYTRQMLADMLGYLIEMAYVEAGDILAGLRPLSVRGHRDPAIGMPLKPAGKIKL